jgi:anti-anti-sigma factor
MFTQWGYGLPDQAPPTPRPRPPPGAATPGWLRHLRGDVTGGVAAAVLTIPISMGYGLLALSALGEAYVPQAILAGLYAPIFGCLVALLLGANTTLVYSPRSIITFLIGAIVVQSLVRSDVPALQAASGATLLGLAFLLMFMAGLFQALFGLMKLGTLVKYIPAPVIAGFQNGAAILIFFSQLDAMLGFEQHIPAINIALHLDEIKWPTLLVGVIACALMLRGARLTRKIPPTILGLAAGVAAYYSFVLLGFGAELGPVVGAIPFGLPDPKYFADFVEFATSPDMRQIAPVLVGGAFSLAIVASLDAMLCARLVQADSGQRVRDNRELVRLGLGNMVSAGFGGIANGVNLGSSFANHRSGARTPLSLLVHAGVIFLAIVAFSPLISFLPRAVIAGMLTAIAIQLVDRWTLQILSNFMKGELSSGRRMLLDLLVIMLVTIAAVAMNVVLAVIVGTAVTIIFFLFRMSRSVIRRAYRCDAVHSRRTREPKHMELLLKHGARIAVLELEGPIFFGTAENLAAYIDSELLHTTSYVILDLKRVNDIDSTGAKILLHAHDRLTKEGKFLVLSAFEERTQLAAFLKDMGVAAALGRKRLFHDTDRAIEWAEDHLLLSTLGDMEAGAEFPFGQLDVFAHMDENELAVLRAALLRRTYRSGEVVFREGDESKELYIIAKGTASVRLRLPGTDRETRLITFSPGTVFGELALLDQEARSASVEADDDLVCYVLAHSSFETLTRVEPLIAIKLLTNLGRELSGRLRRANRTIYQLAS